MCLQLLRGRAQLWCASVPGRAVPQACLASFVGSLPGFVCCKHWLARFCVLETLAKVFALYEVQPARCWSLGWSDTSLTLLWAVVTALQLLFIVCIYW